MIEIRLDTPIKDNKKRHKRLFAICNEKGEYLKNYRPYWTNDLNSTVSNLRSENTAIDTARRMLKVRAEYDSHKSNCYNFDLYYGFEKLFIKEVTIVEV